MSTEHDKDPHLLVMGVLLGAHGVRGDCKVKSFTQDPDALFDYDTLLDGEGQPLLTVKSYRLAGKVYIVTPQNPLTKEAWDGMKGSLLHIHRDSLPEATSEEVYVEDLIGLTAQTEAGDLLGQIKAVHNFGAGDVLEIKPVSGGADMLIPFTKEDVPLYDLENGHVVIASADLWQQAQSGPKSKRGSDTSD